MPAIAYAAGITQSFVTNAWVLVEDTAGSPGKAIMITASTAGSVTLTFNNGDTIVVTAQLGDNIYPFAVQKATVGTAVVTAYYNLA